MPHRRLVAPISDDLAERRPFLGEGASLTRRVEVTTSGGTRYHAGLEITPSGVLRIVDPLMRSMVRKTMVRYGEILKRILEV